MYNQPVNDPYSTTTSTVSPGVSLGLTFFYLAVLVLVIVAQWKVFTKAGKPGWAAIVPIYNYLVLLQVAERPWWWIFLLFIPLINIIFVFIVYIDIAKAFGKSALWGFFMLGILGIIGLPMLAFGSARYVGKGGNAGPSDPGAPTMPPTTPNVTPPAPPTVPPAATPGV